MRACDLEWVVRTTIEYRGAGVYQGIHALQKESEITRLAAKIQALKPRVIVEIGTARGGTLFIWARTNPTSELIVSIDLPGGEFGGGYDPRRGKMYREFAYGNPATELVLLRCDSHAQSSFDTLVAQLGGRNVDFLWIDGDHTYAGVEADFEMYRALVRKGGVVAFHDILTKGEGHEVWKFWNDVKTAHVFEEIIEDPSSNMGIGILTL
jgi:cephalosporin hydroxylase